MEFFGKLSEELTNTFVRPHTNLIELEEQESGGVVFRADFSDSEEEFEEQNTFTVEELITLTEEEQNTFTEDDFLEGVSKVFGFPLGYLKTFSISKIELEVVDLAGWSYLCLKLHREEGDITDTRCEVVSLSKYPIFAKLIKFKSQQGAV
eukprot:GHVP01027648.1.p1 GENE.GHVP01027648.1~~GHVP01027648.1.p1  ORF type:complete len:157 (+),score=20.08 GHVP01027648.1:22-471(+)